MQTRSSRLFTRGNEGQLEKFLSFDWSHHDVASFSFLSFLPESFVVDPSKLECDISTIRTIQMTFEFFADILKVYFGGDRFTNMFDEVKEK